MNSSTSPVQQLSQVCLNDVTSFLLNEADMLDEWRLDEWLALFDSCGRYTVAPLQNNNAEPSEALYLVSDDYARLRVRVTHLLGGTAWAELPRSRTRRLITNVRLMDVEPTKITAKANFVVYQFRNSESWEFVGTSQYKLALVEDKLSILHRAIRLDHETMNSHRRLSIIV